MGSERGGCVQEPLIRAISASNPPIRIILKSNPSPQMGSAENEQKSSFK